MADQDKERANEERLKGGMGQQESGQAAQAGNDQVGQGLGQNQAGYGGDNRPTSGEAEIASHDAQQQASQGIGARTDNLGPQPTGGGDQPKSPTTGGPDLSKGIADNNRGGGTTF